MICRSVSDTSSLYSAYSLRWCLMAQFITAAAPNFDAPGTNTNQEAYRLQLKMFLGLVAQQQHLPPLKQLLQLYTVRLCNAPTLPAAVAEFCDQCRLSAVLIS